MSKPMGCCVRSSKRGVYKHIKKPERFQIKKSVHTSMNNKIKKKLSPNLEGRKQSSEKKEIKWGPQKERKEGRKD